MPTSTEDKVKLLCVKYKCSDSLGKVKLKLLRAMRKAERRNSSLNAITHPLQPWTSPCHTVAALPADDVLMTLSNSRYIVFLTRDGRVCRLRCSSRPELTQQKGDNSVASILNSLRRGSGAHGVSFQEESDAEYARQLQAEFEAESHRLLTGAPSDSPFFARASSPSAVLEELDREAHALMYAGMSSSLEPSSDLAGYLDNYDTPIMINSIWRDTGAAATVGDPRNGDSPPPDYRSLFGERRSSGGPPVQGGTLGAELGRANNQSQSSKGNVVWPEMGTLEWLVCKQNPETSSGDNRFIAMAVLHSEILLVSAETRKLYSWSCSESSSSSSRLPSLVPHPLTEELGLASEKVAILESSEVRATIVTESGKVATFYDALLRVSLEEDTPSLIQSLTHPAQTFSEFEGDSVVNLSVSNFITTAVTSSGKVFWWGLCPQDKESSASTSRNQGNQAEEERRQTGSSSRSRSRGTITDGSLVRLKNGPPCGPNSIVYSKSPYAPRVGKTMNIIEHGSLDPKTSVLVKVFKDEYRVTPDASSSKKKSRSDLDTSSRHLSDLDSSSNYNGLEVWKLSDVVFLDDSPAILGRVVTVDHPQAIVDISHSTNESGTLASSSNAKSTLKVFKVSELELCPIDYSETRAQQRKSNAVESSFSSSETKFQGGVGRGGVSHHVAGTVQHHPVCILAPELSSHLQVGSVPTNLLTQQERQHQMGPNSSSFGSIIYGYTPLAVHTSDEGPTMLVERTSDNSTFLVYSGHSSAGGLVSTSFVALNSKDSKPNRHTIEEESIPALEGGFKVDPVALEYSMSLCNKPCKTITEGSKVNTRSKVKVRESAVLASSSSEVESHDSVDVAMKPNPPQRRSSRKRKLETPNIKSVSSSATNKSSESAPSSISNKQSSSTTAESPATSSAHQEKQVLPGDGLSLQPTPKIDSQLLLLRDVNGKICPLLDGLNLRPTHSKMDAALPTLSYGCIACKQYAISKSQSVLVVALVCKNQSLMPAVQSGNVMKVDAVLSSLRDMVQDQTSGKQKSKDSSSSERASHESGTSHAIVPSASETDDEELPSPAKRMKISTPSTPSRELRDPNERDQTKKKESNKSERLQSLSDVPTGMSFEVEIPIVEKSSLSENRSSLQSGGELEAVPIQERSDGGSAVGFCVAEKVSSLGVLFETTVYNSNVLHVCCQLSESGAATSKGSSKATESTKQKLPSWLKSAPGMSELSFEEQRHKFIFSRKRERGRKNLKDLQAMSHSERKLAILEDFLSCDEIQPAVIKLLSSRNADGETPFMTSIHCQNYAAALKILESLEEWSLQQKSNKATTVSASSSNSATTVESRLFTDAILSPSRHGATPIQALLASFSPFYDIQSMRLHVSNLPVNYTAQHLLKLFQLRYPSVYKAKILKGDRDDEKSGSSDEEEEEEDGWSSEEEEGEEESRAPRGEGNTISGLLRRSAARRRRNLRRSTNYTLTGGASSVHPRRGVVHFSNVKELRAAATEMKDYRMITSVSRSTGFGHTQSIHYLRVSLESSSDSDDDADSAERGLGTSGFNFDDFRPLPRFGHDSLRGNRRGTEAGGSRKKNNKGKAASMSKLSSPVLAYQLLQKLLTYHHLVVATDNAGETALSSLVHNSRCLQSLKELQKSLNSKDETENNSENRSHLSSRNRTPNSTATTFGLPRTSTGRPIRSFTTLAELMKSQEEETRSALNIDRYVPSSSTTNTSTGSTSLGAGLGAESGGTTVMPYVSLADWLDNFFTKLQGTPLEGSLPKILTETQQILQNSNSSSPGAGNTDDRSGSSATSAKDTDGDEQAPLSKLAHTSILATSTPKSSLAGKSKTTSSSTKTPTPLKASSTASTEAKDAQMEEKMKEGGAKEVGGASPVALKIFKSTKPFVKTVSAKVDDEVGYSPAAAASDSDDESGTPESKRLRLTSPEPVSKMAESAKFTFTQSLGLKPSEGAKETSHDSGKLSAGEQHENDKQGNVDGGDVDIGEQILRALVTSWPCVVATVLGFYPSCVTKSSSTNTPSGGGILESKSSLQLGLSREETGPGGSSEYNFSSGLDFCSVHTLDSFTNSLVLNCEESTINILVASIIEKMNAAVLSSTRGDNEVDLTLLSESIDFTKPPEEVCDLNCHNVALLVGQRFMNSVVRLLGLEHSRVKNAFLEMQQMRQSNTGESRSRSERDGHTTHFPDTSNSFFDLDRSHSRRERRTTPTPRKNLTVAVKQILSQFSWLAVHSLSEAAEAASAPVRIGVSKPLGASSVLPEYQGASRSAYGSHAYTIPSNNNSLSSQWSLARQLHVRTPQSILTRKKKKKVAQQSFSSLPADGIILRPCSKDHDDGGQCSGADRIGGGVASMIVGGASIHDESFEEEFSDMEGSVADGNPDGPSTSGVTADHTTPTYFTELSLPPEITGEMFLDLDPSSSDDESIMEFPPGSVLHRTHGQGGTTEGDNIDDIYPFAWALDGRRIGENSDANNARPTSPSGATIFHSEPTVPLTSIPSIRFGAGFLARTFARFVKDLVDIAKDIADKKEPQTCLKLPPEIIKTLMNSTVVSMEKTWQWVTSVLDVAEGQLRQGQYFETQRHVVSLRSGSTRYHSSIRPGQVARVSRSFVGSTPGEYITYLLRTHAREDRECLPVLDLYGYEHVVYMLDGLIYTINNWPKAVVTTSVDQSDSSEPYVFESTNQVTASSEDSKMESLTMEVDDNSKSALGTESPCRFFKRTESVTVTMPNDTEIQRHNEQFFGSDGTATTLSLEQPEHAGPPTPWRSQDGRFSQPLNEAYPLAQRPHLLKPFAKKEHLFGTSVSSDTSSDVEKGEDRLNRPRLSVSYSNPIVSDLVAPITMNWSMEEVQQRWHSAISVFAHIFLAEGPGSERSNFLNAKAGFASRMARFRHLVQQLFDASQLTRDWAGTVSNTLSIRVRRDHLLLDSTDLLKQLVRFHYVNLRVKFDGEDGSGPGVNRGFFASLANELKSSDVTKQPMNKLGQFFCEPGKTPEQSGLFAPCPFSPSGLSLSAWHTVISQRKTVFQAIGRFLGLCLWFRYTIPFMVCRHVAKFFLGRELAWHDLAFYNADLYEGLRRMMLDAEEGKKDPEEFVATYCCYFEAPLCGQNSEPWLVELIPGGSKIPVTQQRVKEYVRLYAMFLMVECVKEELQAMKDGLNDIIPSELLSGLTAEDFQLLLSGGSADINVSKLKSVIRFNHTHGNSTTICDRFEKMFWRVVSHMTNSQRQQLLYFATGSATLPASSDTSARNPAVAITIDVISSSSIDSLPVASTCSQRMSIPLYPSYHLLKKKLLQAVQCQAYGLG